jgi:hypothetical protein
LPSSPAHTVLSRVLGHYQPTNINAYIAQQVMSVLTPAFFAAAHFSVGGLALVLFGATLRGA